MIIQSLSLNLSYVLTIPERIYSGHLVYSEHSWSCLLLFVQAIIAWILDSVTYACVWLFTESYILSQARGKCMYWKLIIWVGLKNLPYEYYFHRNILLLLDLFDFFRLLLSFWDGLLLTHGPHLSLKLTCHIPPTSFNSISTLRYICLSILRWLTAHQ